jgi:hypothetical protein
MPLIKEGLNCNDVHGQTGRSSRAGVTVKVNAIHFDREVGDIADQLTGELLAVVSATAAPAHK